MLGVKRAVITAVLLLVHLSLAQAQTLSVTNEIVQLPQAGPVHLWSPDHQWMLVADALPLDHVGEKHVWLEAADGRNRRLVKRYTRSLSLGWAPDSSTFFVNDGWASDREDCEIVDPVSLKSIDVATLLADKPEAQRYLDAGHRYLAAEHWIDSKTLLVKLYGHFDDPPAASFHLTYSVSLDDTTRF